MCGRRCGAGWAAGVYLREESFAPPLRKGRLQHLPQRFELGSADSLRTVSVEQREELPSQHLAAAALAPLLPALELLLDLLEFMCRRLRAVRAVRVGWRRQTAGRLQADNRQTTGRPRGREVLPGRVAQCGQCGQCLRRASAASGSLRLKRATSSANLRASRPSLARRRRRTRSAWGVGCQLAS